MVAALLTLAVTATTAMAGCGKTGGSSAGGDAKLDKDQHLNVFLDTEPKTLDVSKATDSYSSQVMGECSEALARSEVDANGKDVVKPAGAEKWDISKDGMTWTFHMRDNKWSDGKAVTAKDYEYSIKRTLDPKIASQYAFLLSPIKGADEYNNPKKNLTPDTVGVKAVDDKTLEIKLKQPCAYFDKLLYFKVFQPQRQDIVEKYGDKYGSEANTLVFCGPFVLKEWVHGNKVEFEKNPNYWDAKSVKLDKVTMKIIKEEQTRMTEMLNGTVDLGGVNKPEWIKKFDDTKKYDVIKGMDPATNYNMFNEKDKVFKNVKIRQAFSLATEREDIAKTIFKGLATPAYGWCAPKIQIGDKDFRDASGEEPLKQFKKDNPDPKKLLVEGMKEAGLGEDPSKLDVTYLESGTSTTAHEMAEHDQAMIKKNLGVDMKVDYVEFPVFQKRTNEGQYQMAGQGWTGDYNDPMTEFDMWMAGSGMNRTGWTNPKYDELIKKAAALPAEKNAERTELFKQAEKILLVDDAVIAPTIYKQRNTYVAKYVKNFQYPTFGSKYEMKYAYIEGRNK